MALKKVIEAQGEAFMAVPGGNISLGVQKTTFMAYCKIVNVSGNKANGEITVECAGEQQKTMKTYQVQFSVDEGAPNFIKQGYLHLKSLPDWSDAVDC